jgi:hypothetical protein
MIDTSVQLNVIQVFQSPIYRRQVRLRNVVLGLTVPPSLREFFWSPCQTTAMKAGACVEHLSDMCFATRTFYKTTTVAMFTCSSDSLSRS